MNRALIEDEGSTNPMTDSELEARMRGWLVESWTVLMLFNDDDVVGYILYQERENIYLVQRSEIYVRHFYVRRSYRRRGIGRAAFEQIISDWFPPEISITLDVLESNPGGYQFWKRLGFDVHSTTLRRVRPEGSHP